MLGEVEADRGHLHDGRLPWTWHNSHRHLTRCRERGAVHPIRSATSSSIIATTPPSSPKRTEFFNSLLVLLSHITACWRVLLGSRARGLDSALEGRPCRPMTA